MYFDHNHPLWLLCPLTYLHPQFLFFSTALIPGLNGKENRTHPRAHSLDSGECVVGKRGRRRNLGSIVRDSGDQEGMLWKVREF
jgi:hypothetical protein